MPVRHSPRLTWRKSLIAVAVLQGLTGLMGSAQAQAIRWEDAPIPVLSGVDSSTYVVTAMNNVGQSVGTVKVNGVYRAFLNSGGQLLWLGNTGGGAEYWQPKALSDPSGLRGTVNIAGNIFDCPDQSCASPRNFVQTATTLLGQVGAVQTFSFAGAIDSRLTAVNQDGVMAGTFTPARDFDQAFAGSVAGGFTQLQNLSPFGANALAMNNAGIVVGFAGISRSTYSATIWNGRTGSVQDIGTLGGVSSLARGVNDRGTVVGSARFVVAIGDERSSSFIYRNGVTTRIAAELDAGGPDNEAYSINNRDQTLGSFLTVTNQGVPTRQSFIHTASGGAVSLQGLGLSSFGLKMNDLGQVLTVNGALQNPTGTLTWARSAGGSVGVADNWDSGMGFSPNQFLDLVITTARDQTITGDTSFIAKSLRIDGSPLGLGTLALSGGAVVNALNGVTVGVNGRLQGDGRIAGMMVINRGVVNAVAGQVLVMDGGLDNRGLVTGTGRIEANLLNRGGGAAGVQVGAGQNLTLAGTVHSMADGSRARIRDGGTLTFEGRVVNQGGATLEIQRGALQVGYGVDRMQNAGLVLVGNGRADLRGDVFNGPRGVVHATDDADLALWDELINDGELRVSGGARIVYAGAVSGKGSFTGLVGMHRFEGGYSPGASPAQVLMANVQFASQLTMELGGLAAGSQHDRIVFGGSVLFDVNSFLKVRLINGFAPVVGDSFALFSYALAPSGNFGDFNLPGLGAGLNWDISQIYTSGVLRVTAVPEPGTWALMLTGVLGLIGLRRTALGVGQGA